MTFVVHEMVVDVK